MLKINTYYDTDTCTDVVTFSVEDHYISVRVGQNIGMKEFCSIVEDALNRLA